MKAVFPTKGALIVTKYNVNMLNDFYKNNLINSKLFAAYQQSNFYMQSGNFNYFPKKSNIIVYNAHLLTLQRLQEVIAAEMNAQKEAAQSATEVSKEQETSNEEPVENTFSDEPLDDNFIQSNSFFKTLTAND